LSDLRIEKVYK